jgi:hypothetical protein
MHVDWVYKIKNIHGASSVVGKQSDIAGGTMVMGNVNNRKMKSIPANRKNDLSKSLFFLQRKRKKMKVEKKKEIRNEC